MKQTLVP